MDTTTNAPQPAEGMQPAPAMDIVPPPKFAEAPQDVSVPVPAPQDAADMNTKPLAARPAKQAVVKPPKAPASGVGLAIFATIIIVLGLGMLMVYAYLRGNGINLL